MADLIPVFQEPTVGGLTGAQHQQLRLWETEAQYDREGLCEFEFFPKDPQGPAEYCPEDAESWSLFCSDHQPEQDEFDVWRDGTYGYDD
jgi:hypothetical protein